MAKKSLFAALEELNEAGMGVDETVVADGGETEIMEAAEAGGEMDSQVDTIEEAHEDSDTLGAISEVLEDSIEEGGVDQATARVAEIAVESIYKRLGVSKKAMPSMESFGSRSSRVRATQIALEGIGEVVSKIWEAIKAAFIKLWSWMKQTWNSLFDAKTKLIARADALLARVNSLEGDATETEFKDGTLYSKLTTSKGFSAKGLGNILTNFKGEVTKLKDLRTEIKDVNTTYKKAVSDASKSKDKGNYVEGIATDINSIFSSFRSKFFNAPVHNKDHQEHKSLEVGGSGELPGNKELIFSYITDKTPASEIKEALSYVGIKEIVFDADLEKDEDVELEVGAKNDLRSICQSVKAVLVSFDGNKTIETDLEKAVKDITATIDAALKQGDKSTDLANKSALKNKDTKEDAKDSVSDTKEGFAILMKSVSKTTNVFTQYATIVQKTAITASKYSLDYVDKCCGLYKKA